MSDLSRMLDDLYALPEVDENDVEERPTRAPEWSSAEALDEAFSSWVPGESEGSSAFERSMAEHEPPPTLAEALRVDVEDWLAETEPVALEPVALESVTPEPAVTEPVLAGVIRWSPSDDDILSSRGRTRGRRR